MRRFEEPGSLFSIPLDENHFAVAQVVVSHGDAGGFGVLDAVFSRDELVKLDVDALRELKRYRHVYAGCGRRWRDLGVTAPILPSVSARYLRWSEMPVARHGRAAGTYVVEQDPCRSEYECWSRVERVPPEMSAYDQYGGCGIPEMLEDELRERWGIGVPEVLRSRRSMACEVLLESSAVAQVSDEAEREGPRWARRRLAMAARLALETAGYLDVEIGGPALAAACATRDAELARAFRSTTKTVTAAVDRPKAVARRVLDPQTSELAELHRDAGTLEALEEYVEGLGLEDTTK